MKSAPPNCHNKNIVLVFNPLKRLVGIFGSENSAAKAFDVSVVSLHMACKGDTISCSGLYFRNLDENIEVTFDDFGVLRLEDYDQMCGVTRKYYPSKEMTRKGMKYNTKKKSKKNED